MDNFNFDRMIQSLLHRMAQLVILGTFGFAANCSKPSLLQSLPAVSDLDRAYARSHCDAGTRLLNEAGNVLNASKEFEQALAQDPADPLCRQWASWNALLQGDEGHAFELLLRTLNPNNPVAELSIWTAYRLFDNRDQAEQLREALDKLIAEPDTPPLVRSRAQYFLGQILRTLGRPSEANAAFQKLQILNQWMVVGPFNNDQNAGYNTAFGPELGLDNYQQRYPGKLREVGFRRVEHLDFDGRINLSALLDPSRWTCAYLVTFVQSPKDEDVAFRLAAHRGVKLWLNGRLLLADDLAQSGAQDQYVVGARLEKGWNRLLVKVCQRTGEWQLRLRVTDLAGNPLEGILTAVDIHPTPDRSGDTSPLPEPESFQRFLSRQSDDPRGFWSLAQAQWSQRLGFSQQAIEQAIRLTARFPKSPLAQMLLAQAHFDSEHESSALKAIQNAERISPGLAGAILERARYEQQHSRFDRALKILSPLWAKPNPLPSVRRMYISLLVDRGFYVDALRESERLSKEFPTQPWAWKTIGNLHFLQEQPELGNEAYQRAYQLCHNDQTIYNRLIESFLKRGDYSEALSWIRRKIQTFPGLIGARIREAEVLLAQGNPTAALTVLDQIESISPEYWEIQKTRGDILYRQGDRAAALKSYHQSLSLYPDNPSLREYVDFLEPSSDAVFEHYELSDAEWEELSSKKVNPADYPEAEAVFLLDDLITHVFQDGSSKHMVRQSYLILNEQGRQRFNHFRVPYSSSFRLERAETIQPDGTRQEATSIQAGVIQFPSLSPGSIVQVAYGYESSSSSWMENHFAMSFTFQGSYPTKKARWVLVCPPEKKLTVLKQGSLVQERLETIDQQQVFIWTAENTPLLHQEAFRPPVRLIQSAVYVSTVPSWEELAKWQNSLISDQFEIDEEVRNKTHEITRGANTPLEKLQAVYNFVAKEIRYLDNDMGIFGKKPDKAINIFENHFGDCKDKATLMIAMLKELGIEAAYAAVRTFDRGPIFWEVPDAQTNHIITFIPAQAGIEQPFFVDGTSRFGNFRFLPDMDQGIKAMVLDGKSYQILQTPLLNPEASTLDCRMRVEISENKNLNIYANERWTGWFAVLHRSQLAVEGKRQEELARELAFRYPGANVNNANFYGLTDLSEEAGMQFQLEVPNGVRQEENSLRINLLWPFNTLRNMARNPERHYDIFLPIRNHVQIQSTLKLPSNMVAKTLPRSLSIDNDLILFDQKCQQESEQITCSKVMEFKSRLVPKDRYGEFRDLCAQIDQAEGQDIVLVPASKASRFR